MNKWLLNSIGVALLAVLGLGTWGGFGLTKQAYIALQNLGNEAEELQRTTADIQRTVNTLSGPCKDIQGDYICPPLTQLSQTEKNIAILAGKSAQQTMQVGTLVTAVARNLDTVGDSVRTVAGTLSGTASQATQTLQQAQTDLQTANGSIQGIGPLISHSDATVTDLDALLKDQAIRNTLTNVQFATQSAAQITDNLNVWSKPFLNPAPCTTFRCNFSRHVLGPAKAILGLSGAAYEGTLWGRAFPVTIRP